MGDPQTIDNMSFLQQCLGIDCLVSTIYIYICIVIYVVVVTYIHGCFPDPSISSEASFNGTPRSELPLDEIAKQIQERQCDPGPEENRMP